MPQHDDYRVPTKIDGPADDAQAVVFGSPGGEFVFDKVTRAIYVGTAGSVAVRMKSGVVVVHKAGDGAILPVRARAIVAAGTDATDIVGWF